MQTVNPYARQYRKNQIETATPEQILILLYDGAIQYLNKAKIAISQNDVNESSTNIYNCQQIIIEFMNSLDMENGGEVAVNLRELYRYLYRTLVDAGFSKDTAKIDEVLNHLKGLRETWLKAIDIANEERKAAIVNGSSNEHATFDRYDSKDTDSDSEYYDDGYDDEDDDEEDDADE